MTCMKDEHIVLRGTRKTHVDIATEKVHDSATVHISQPVKLIIKTSDLPPNWRRLEKAQRGVHDSQEHAVMQFTRTSQGAENPQEQTRQCTRCTAQGHADSIDRNVPADVGCRAGVAPLHESYVGADAEGLRCDHEDEEQGETEWRRRLNVGRVDLPLDAANLAVLLGQRGGLSEIGCDRGMDFLDWEELCGSKGLAGDRNHKRLFEFNVAFVRVGLLV